MNPNPESWLTPWVKNPESNKYDLDTWNDAFFSRLKDFVSAASEKGIVVEITIFTSYYSNHQWSVSPFHPKNNIQGIDSISFKQVNTLNNGKLLAIQEKYVRKIVSELNSFGNLFFEIQNEPWADNPQFLEKIAETDTMTHQAKWQRIVEIGNKQSLNWQKKIAAVIADEESQLPNKHLIAQNISNFRNKIENPDPNVSIFNFHYAYPEASAQNLGLGKVIGLDETGFMPHQDIHYRSQAWKMLLAGSALYNNLDYSFTVGSEDGSNAIDAGTPGWGGVEYRKQVKIMKDFVENLDFIRMKPDNSILKTVQGTVAYYQVLTEPGKQVAIYMEKADGATVQLTISDGEYRMEWLNPNTGFIQKTGKVVVTGGKTELPCPDWAEDLVLKMVR